MPARLPAPRSLLQVHFIDADTGAEAQNTDFVTMTGCSFSITASR